VTPAASNLVATGLAARREIELEDYANMARLLRMEQI